MSKILREVFKVRPFLQQLLQERGSEGMLEYMRSTCDYGTKDMHALHRERFPGFLAQLRLVVEKDYGKNTADKVIDLMKRRSVLNTGPHQGMFTSPEEFCSNLNMGMVDGFDSNGVVPVAASAKVLTTNPTGPFDLIFPGMPRGSVDFLHLPLTKKGGHVKKMAIWLPRLKMGQPQLDGIFKEIWKMREGGQIDQPTYEGLMVTWAMMRDDYFSKKSGELGFHHQMFHLARRIWEKSFAFKPPELVPFQLEKLVIPLLIDNIKEKGLFYNLLFDRGIREMAYKLFDGIPGCWGEHGSAFFQGLNKNGEPVDLILEGGKLVPKNGNEWVVSKKETREALDLNEEDVINALEKFEILPTIMVMLGLLYFYYGVKVLGGYMQVDYLSRMHKAWINLLEGTLPDEYDAVRSLDPQGFCLTPVGALTRLDDGGIAMSNFTDIFRQPLSREYLEWMTEQKLSDLTKWGSGIAYSNIYGGDASPELIGSGAMVDVKDFPF